MPQLPSGRHIAVDPTPLHTLLQDANSVSAVHRIMAIESVDDIFRWLDVMRLQPAAVPDGADAEAPADPRNFARAPLPVPAGLVPSTTGVRLADWDTLAADWSDDDRRAMAEFIEHRVRPWTTPALDVVRRVQDRLLAQPTTAAGLLASMWRAGCHPLQEEGAIDGPLPPQDFAARLAALLRARALLREHPQLPGVSRNTRDRLEGLVAVFEQRLDLPQLAADADLAAWIAAVRAADPLADAREGDRQWFPAQVRIECEALWDGVGDALRRLDPAVHDLIGTAAISADRGQS